MLIPMAIAARIGAGEVTLAFRSWKRPTVKAGGTLQTVVGQLAIDEVAAVDRASITDADARDAGAADAEDLRRHLPDDPDRTTYRIAFHLLGPDPRIALRKADQLGETEVAELRRKLDGYDRRAAGGPWTRAVLELIRDRPAVVSTELAEAVGIDRPTFKLSVRKLKALGLTESLEVGYRLSPRGSALLSAFDDPAT